MMRKLNVVVMTLAGLLLIAAAILKTHEVLTVYFPSWDEEGIWESWEFFLVQIPVEFSLGVWMVSGLFRKASWTAGTIAYILFIFVQLYKGLTGAESCGCFGHVQVNPWVTLFAIDLPFAAGLLIFRPKGQKLLPPPWPNVGHALATAVPIFAALIFAAPLLVAFRPDFIKPEDWQPQITPVRKPAGDPKPVESTEDAAPEEPTETAVEPEPEPKIPEPEPHTPIEPDKPVEKPESTEKLTPDPEPVPDETEKTEDPDEKPTEPVEEAKTPELWPWLEHIDIAEQLKDGLVVVYLYHYNCSVCTDSVPKYEAYSRQMAGEFTLAYVAIPPYGRDENGLIPPDTPNLHGKLTDKQRWAITSPLVVALIEGSVVKIWPQGSAPEPENLLDEIFAP